MNASITNGETTTPPRTRRRDFLTLCAGAGVLFYIPLVDGLAALRHKRAAAPVPPTASMPGLSGFQPHLDSVFVAAATESQPSVSLTLAKVEAIAIPTGFSGEQFSLRFDAPPGHVIESRIHQLHHPVLGDLELFISPVGSADRFGGRQKGEAVVSSLVRLS